MKNASEGRWLAFRAVEPLPADTRSPVTVGPGTPSAEGPLVTTEAQSFSFRTYAPLRIDDHGCSWSAATLPPLTPFYIRFNNPHRRQQATARIMLPSSRNCPARRSTCIGNTLQIQGASKGPDHLYGHDQRQHPGYFRAEPWRRRCELTFRVGPGRAGAVRAGRALSSPSTRRRKSRSFLFTRSITPGWT